MYIVKQVFWNNISMVLENDYKSKLHAFNSEVAFLFQIEVYQLLGLMGK